MGNLVNDHFTLKTAEEITTERLLNELEPIVKRVLNLARTNKQIEVDNTLKKVARKVIVPFKEHGFQVLDTNFTPLWKRSVVLFEELKRLEREGEIDKMTEFRTCALLTDRQCVVQLTKVIMEDDGNDIEIEMILEITFRYKKKHEVMIELTHKSKFGEFLQPKKSDILVLFDKFKGIALELVEASRPKVTTLVAGETNIEHDDCEGGLFRVIGNGEFANIDEAWVSDLLTNLNTLASRDLFETGNTIEHEKVNLDTEGNLEILDSKEVTKDEYLTRATEVI